MIDIEFVTKFVMPPILGGIAGFFAPWVKYIFETRILRHSDRRALVNQWRNDLLATDLYFREISPLIPQDTYRSIIARPSYALLKPHLSKSALAELKKYSGGTITIQVGGTENPIREIIAREIARIEKAWKLI
jgi:hypothetical protein